jgi:hypothetical protein
VITHSFKQGKNKITIETAESLQDAKENNFKDGEFVRHYINGKAVTNYMAMIRFIVDESKKNKERFIPTGMSADKLRELMISRQEKAVHKQLSKLKEQYGDQGVPEDVLQKANGFIDKIDPIGVRIKE